MRVRLTRTQEIGTERERERERERAGKMAALCDDVSAHCLQVTVLENHSHR